MKLPQAKVRNRTAGRYCYNLLIYYWIFPVAILLYGLWGGGNTKGYVWWALTASIACGVPLIASAKRPGTLAVIVTLSHVVYFPLAVILNLLPSTPGVYEQPIWENTPEAMVLCAIGMIGFGAGIWGAKSVRFSPIRERDPASLQSVKSPLLLALTAAILPYAVILFVNNSYFHTSASTNYGWSPEDTDHIAWTGYLEYVCYAGVFLLLLKWHESRKGRDLAFACAGVLLPLIVLLPSGSRDMALRGVVSTLAVFTLAHIRVPWRRALLIVTAAGLCLWYLIIGTELYRNRIRYGGERADSFSDRAALVGSALIAATPGLGSERTYDEQLQMLGRRFADYVVPAMMVDYFPAVENYRGFEGVSTWIPYLLPHQLRPAAFQADPRDGALLSTRVGFKGGTLAIYNPTSDGSSPSMIIGDWYSRFGWLGVLLGMALCGWFLGVLDSWLLAGGVYRSICIGILVLPAIKLSHQSVFIWFIFFTRALLITLVLGSIVYYTLRVFTPKVLRVKSVSNAE